VKLPVDQAEPVGQLIDGKLFDETTAGCRRRARA
jgi:hypothetical protein